MLEYFLADPHYWDWATVIIVGCLSLPFELFLAPNHRLFRLDDPDIAYPFTEHEHVPNWLLVVLAFLLPLAMITSIGFLRPKVSMRALKVAVLGFLLSFAVNVLITGLLKYWIGNTRPDFLARCLPAKGTATNVYVNASVCTTNNIKRLEEGYRSSPSGHSSNAFCGLVYLTLWLASQFGTLKVGAPAFKVLLGLVPVLLAMYIAVSRIVDYRHHWYDVFAGSLIGALISWFCYHRYFPRVISANPQTPLMDEETPVSPV